MSAVKRLQRELHQLWSALRATPWVTAAPLDADTAAGLLEWHCDVLLGDAPQARRLHVVLRFPDAYPAQPPRVHLHTPFPHPNVLPDGTVCLSVLEAGAWCHGTSARRPHSGWSPAYTVHGLLLQLHHALLGGGTPALVPRPCATCGGNTRPPRPGRAAPAPPCDAAALPPATLQYANGFLGLPLDVALRCVALLGPGAYLAFAGVCRDAHRLVQAPYHARHLRALRDDLRCFHSRASYADDVLGIALDVTLHPKFARVAGIASTFDLLSAAAFHGDGVRAAPWGERFTHWLPLYITADHFRRALPHFRRSVAVLASHALCDATLHLPDTDWGDAQAMAALGLPLGFASHAARRADLSAAALDRAFRPDDAVAVLAQLMSTTLVRLAGPDAHASLKALAGYCAAHRLLVACLEQWPGLQGAVDARVRAFCAGPGGRTKAACPDLGHFLALLSVATATWEEVCVPVVEESMIRGAMWAVREDPGLDPDHPARPADDEAYLARALAARLKSCTLPLAVHCLRHVARPPGVPLRDVAARYDALLGQPSVAQQRRLQAALRAVRGVRTWEGLLAAMGLPAPASRAHLAHWLRESVRASVRRGYHSRDLAAVVMAQGDVFCVGAGVTQAVLEVGWRWAGPGSGFADAVAVLYDARGALLGLVDFSRPARPGVRHSGDCVLEERREARQRVVVDFRAVPEDVAAVIFAVTQWPGGAAQGEGVQEPWLTVTDQSDRVLCRYDFAASPPVPGRTGVLLCKLHRDRALWKARVLGRPCGGHAADYGPLLDAADAHCGQPPGTARAAYAQALRRVGVPGVDLVFCLDCTGSMNAWITAAKEQVAEVATAVEAWVQTNCSARGPGDEGRGACAGVPACAVRCGVVAYRDHCDRDARLHSLDLSADLDAVRGYIGALRAYGGGDRPEDVLGGLNEALALTWDAAAAKVLVLISDAPCHGAAYHALPDAHPAGDPHGLTPELLLRHMHERRVHLLFTSIRPETDRMLREFRRIYDDTSTRMTITELHLQQQPPARLALVVTSAVCAARRTSPEARAVRRRSGVHDCVPAHDSGPPDPRRRWSVDAGGPPVAGHGAGHGGAAERVRAAAARRRAVVRGLRRGVRRRRPCDPTGHAEGGRGGSSAAVAEGAAERADGGAQGTGAGRAGGRGAAGRCVVQCHGHTVLGGLCPGNHRRGRLHCAARLWAAPGLRVGGRVPGARPPGVRRGGPAAAPGAGSGAAAHVRGVRGAAGHAPGADGLPVWRRDDRWRRRGRGCGAREQGRGSAGGSGR